MKIADLDSFLKQEEAELKLGKAIKDAFPRLKSSRDLGGFFDPTECLVRFLVWIWLCEKKQNQGAIDVVANEVLKRSFALIGKDLPSNARDRFEYLLLCACVVVGDLSLARQVASKVKFARANSSAYRICASIIKVRILNIEGQKTKQITHLQKFKGPFTVIWVGYPQLWKAFVEHDNEALEREANRVCKKHTKVLRENRLPQERKNGTVDMSYWSLNSFWPWAEIVLLKLAFGPKKAPSIDEFWIPEGLLRRSVDS